MKSYRRGLSMIVIGWSVVILGCQTLNASKARLDAMSASPDMTRLNSVESVERNLASVKSDRVIVKTEVLRSMLKNEKQREQQCSALNDQLKALKDLDFQKTEGNL